MDPVETYLKELRDIRSTGAGVAETSFYPALSNLFNEIGKGLKPKVRCVINLANRGAGLPDGGFFTPEQLKQTDLDPMQGQGPSRGAMEVKPTGREIADIAAGPQVQRYCRQYGLVLVTNYRDFALVGQSGGRPAILETYRLAESEAAFWSAAQHPRAAAEKHGERFTGYLMRVMQHNAPLADPKDLAWFLASYARDALARIRGGHMPALASLRKALQDSLGMSFSGQRGEHFFESTLVQTLFYGVFSAWVLWAREHPPADTAQFDWQHAANYLRVPVLRKLFHEATEPGQLEDLNLAEVLRWAATTLNRVDRGAFFERFAQHHAVQYFYEPFLEAYDPELRKELGVWYTPPEIVEYMVKRVDRVLREELDVPDGLADPRVYVLDPCCGTGAFLVGVLDQIAATLAGRGGDALDGHDLKTAAQERVFGFEILPAPYVVSHLQLGLRLADLGVPLTGKQRVGVYLTNALTGWEPPKEPQATLPFVEFQEEHDAADSVKQSTPILVILGNPPYNGFADVAVEEERDLSSAYRTTQRAPKPQGQGLNDLYVRFFRMAERRIVEKTGRGVVCFISNYSWLDGLSHTGMRERYLEAFDGIWIDCLNGDKYKTGKLTPEGKPDPSVFSTEHNREGIQVGTAIALMVRKEQHTDAQAVNFRHFWGKEKRAELLASANGKGDGSYTTNIPAVEIGCPFLPTSFNMAYMDWPNLPDLLPWYTPAVKTSRDDLVVDVDKDNLVARMRRYFDPKTSNEELGRLLPVAMTKTATFDPETVRARLVKRGYSPGFLMTYAYRPLDMQWVYWELETNLLDRKREELYAARHGGNMFLTSRQKGERTREGSPFFVTSSLADYHLTRPGSTCFALFDPVPVGQPGLGFDDANAKGQRRPNLSAKALQYLETLSINPERNAGEADLIWMHVLAIGHSSGYLKENSGMLWQDWPRVPLPATRAALEASAALGRRVAALLDVEQPVKGVTTGMIDPALKVIGVITKAGTGGRPAQINDADDLALTAGWGHAGRGGITMPASGKTLPRDYTSEERAALCGESCSAGTSDPLVLLGPTTLDVCLNEKVYWRNIPTAVWEYTLGGYQVIKKWLSYREQKLLGRALRAEEARHVTDTSRRLAALLLLQPELDENYRRVKESCYDFKESQSGQ